jgi:hypothetical protein
MNSGPRSNSGVPLTPSVAKSIIVELFEDKPQWTTAELIQKVPAIHRDRGGVPGRDSIKNVINKALGYLDDDGFIHNKAYGVWERTGEDVHGPHLVEEAAQAPAAVQPRIKVEKILGEGPESVYVYYYESERELATYRKDSVWQCKIGESGTSDPIDRVIAQCGTSRHTLPKIPLVIKSYDSEGIEKLIHRVFRLAGLGIKNDSCGDEWFMTNPQQIDICYESIHDLIQKLRIIEQREER